RVVGAASVAIETKRVIQTGNLVAYPLSQMQRGKAVRAPVIQRDRRAVLFSIKDNRRIEEGSREQALFRNLIRQRAHVPGILQVAMSVHFEALPYGLLRSR